MAFNLNSLDPTNSGSGGASSLGSYRTNTDTKSAVLAPGYFNEAAGNLRWTKALLVAASDEVFIATVDVDLDDDTVTLTEFGAVKPEDILAVLADPDNLPVNVGDVLQIDGDGISHLLDAGGTAYPAPLLPYVGALPDEGVFYLPWISHEPLLGRAVLSRAGDVFNSTATGAVPYNSFIRSGSGGRLAVGDVEANTTGTGRDNFAVNFKSLKQWLLPLASANFSADNRDYLPMIGRVGSVYTPTYQTLSIYASAPSENEIARFGTGGRLRIANGTAGTDAVNLGQLNGRLSASQRSAIDALDAGTATVEDVINALKAT